MGTWRFYGGLVWNKDRFVSNSCTDITVVNENDRTTYLSESCLLLPGLIDFHCHVWAPGASIGVTDTEYLSSGLIACADAGTFGYDGWENADRLWGNSSLIIRSWLSVLPEGLTINPNPNPTPPDNISIERLVETASFAGKRLLGFKVRLGLIDEVTDRGLLRIARTAAEKAGLRMMVHLTETFLSIEEVVESLRPGDVLTHPFHGERGNILDHRGRISAAFKSAVERGLFLDLGQGRTHFTWRVFRKALSEGIKPDTISSDLIRASWQNPPVKDLSYIISRFVAAGLSREEIFVSMLQTAARFMGVEIDDSKNVVVLERTFSENYFADAEGEKILGNVLYVPKFHINNGRPVFAKIEGK